MGDIVNLRQARKQKDRVDKARDAQANRVKFGQTKAQKHAQRDEAARQAKNLDGHRIDRDDDRQDQ